MTKLKNQIYYLQQSIILLKTNAQINFGGSNADEVNSNGNTGNDASPTTILHSRRTTNSLMSTELAENPVFLPGGDINSVINHLNQRISECTPEAHFRDFSRDIEVKINACSDEIENTKTKWKMDTSNVNNYIKKNVTKLSKRLNGVTKRLEVAENNAKKYNLIISGIPQTRKLERTSHLERLIKDFFQDVLSLPKVQFDEVQRINHNVDSKPNAADENGNNQGIIGIL